jgi:hypothetical protein
MSSSGSTAPVFVVPADAITMLRLRTSGLSSAMAIFRSRGGMRN